MIRAKEIAYNKRTIFLLVLMIVLFSILSPMSTFCKQDKIYTLMNDLDSSVIEELDEIDFSGLEQVVIDFNGKNTNIFSIENIKGKVYSIISGESAVEYESVIGCLVSNLVEMVLKYLPMLSIIIAIGVLSNILNGIKSKFSEKSVGDLIHLVCFLAVVVLMIGIINNLSKTTGQSIGSMVSQMNALFPILLTLMVGLGATASAGVFQPIVAILSTYVADFFNYLIIPLFLFSFVFSIISNMSSSIKLDKFSDFISSLFKWAVGLTFTIFFAVFTIQGISAGSFDSISIRTAKYSIKSYVPIMGGYLSDGMDLILSSTLLIKNSVGLVGLLIIITTILSPVLEIVVCSLLLKLTSAVLQPLGDSKISNFLSSTSKSIIMLSTCVIAIGFMYLISIGLVMMTSNVVI